MIVLNNYFQRYSERENVVTDNTMRLLKMLQDYKVSYYNNFLSRIGAIEDKSLDINIVVQEKVESTKSLPDAIISQVGYKIVIEVKLSNNFDETQLINHLEELKGNIENKILLTIGKEKMIPTTKLKIDEMTSSVLAKHVNITFSDIVNIIFDIVKGDIYFENILEDYKNFCLANNILETSKNKLYVFAVKDTMNLDVKYNLYYRPYQNYEAFEYLGLYNNKEIKYIGKVKARVLVKITENDEIEIQANNISEHDRNKIIAAVGDDDFTGEKGNSYYFYLVDKFIKTSYKKETPYPIFGRKLFDLEQVIGSKVSDMSLENIIDVLNNKTW